MIQDVENTSNDDLDFFTKRYVGIDEAGRGTFVGPVFAAAVMFLPEQVYLWEKNKDPMWINIKDSKKYNKKTKNGVKEIIPHELLRMRDWIMENAYWWAVDSASLSEISQYDILGATMNAMHRCLDKLTIMPDEILVDGNFFKKYVTKNGIQIPHRCVIKGDLYYKCISAASILAKTFRDVYVVEMLHPLHPEYDWINNKGYGSAKNHVEAMKKYGLTEFHRTNFNIRVIDKNTTEDNKKICPI